MRGIIKAPLSKGEKSHLMGPNGLPPLNSPNFHAAFIKVSSQAISVLLTAPKMSATYKPESKWKALAIVSTALCLLLMFVMTCGFYLARLNQMDHHNLYYKLWKAGLRDYDWSIASRGMTHDLKFRQSLHGSTLEEFEERFPNTFHEKSGRVTKPSNNRHVIYARDYEYFETSGPLEGSGWKAIFIRGKLVDLSWDKGI